MERSPPPPKTRNSLPLGELGDQRLDFACTPHANRRRDGAKKEARRPAGRALPPAVSALWFLGMDETSGDARGALIRYGRGASSSVD